MALTTIDKCKTHLNIGDTTHDSVLTQLVDDVSERIKTYCGRTLEAADYCEYHTLCGDRKLYVRNWPLIEVKRVAFGTQDAITLSYGGTDIRARVQVTESAIVLTTIDASGSETESTVDFATYPTISTAVTQINTVSNWTATNALGSADGLACNLWPIGGLDASSSVNLTWPDQDNSTYEVDHASGGIFLQTRNDFAVGAGGAGRMSGRYLVEYRGGYATIPGDIDMVAIEMVTEAFQRTQLNVGASSESLDGWSASATPVGQLTADQRERLRPYMDISVGKL